MVGLSTGVGTNANASLDRVAHDGAVGERQDRSVLGLTRIAIAGPSMLPALRPGDWWLVRTFGPVRAGQVVLARHPQRIDLPIVKRAIHRESDGRWWVEGDAPGEDSRDFGPVDVEGVLMVRYRRAG